MIESKNLKFTFSGFVHTGIPLESTADIVCKGVGRHPKLQVTYLLKFTGIKHQITLPKPSPHPTGFFSLKTFLLQILFNDNNCISLFSKSCDPPEQIKANIVYLLLTD